MFWRKRSPDQAEARPAGASSSPSASANGGPADRLADEVPAKHAPTATLPVLSDVVDTREVSVPGPDRNHDGPFGCTALSGAKPSVHSLGTHITGEIASLGPLHIEGSVTGVVTARELSIGPHAAVDGRVGAGHLRMSGRIAGEVVCDRLEMGSSASLQGTLVCKQIALEHGAVLQGEVSVG